MTKPTRQRTNKSKGKKGERPASSAPLGDVARHAAFLALSRHTRKWPEFDLHALDGAIEAVASGSTDRDRAFAHAIHRAAVARWLTLRYLIGLFCQRPVNEMDPKVMGALIGGSAQIVFMDRVPVHAAINHAVEWAKIEGHPRAGGLVNAVLRRIAGLVLHAEHDGTLAGKIQTRQTYSDQRDELPLGGWELRDSDPGAKAIVLSSGILPEDPIERLAVATSHPRELIVQWQRAGSDRDVRARCLHSLVDPPVILNVAYCRGEMPANCESHTVPGHAVFTGSHAELVELLQARRDVWVQDCASSRAILSVQHLRPGLILDLCAGQGTKTRQLCATFPDAKIVATDIDEPRFATLAKQFEGSAQVTVLPMARVRSEYLGKADLIMVDVPCSNTGVLPRRPEARYRFGKKATESLTNAQRQILADSIPLLNTNPRGHILYSTCSLEPEENNAQGTWIAKWHGYRLSHESVTIPKGVPGSATTEYSDGAYSVLISS